MRARRARRSSSLDATRASSLVRRAARARASSALTPTRERRTMTRKCTSSIITRDDAPMRECAKARNIARRSMTNRIDRARRGAWRGLCWGSVLCFFACFLRVFCVFCWGSVLCFFTYFCACFVRFLSGVRRVRVTTSRANARPRSSVESRRRRPKEKPRPWGVVFFCFFVTFLRVLGPRAYDFAPDDDDHERGGHRFRARNARRF